MIMKLPGRSGTHLVSEDCQELLDPISQIPTAVEPGWSWLMLLMFWFIIS